MNNIDVYDVLTGEDRNIFQRAIDYFLFGGVYPIDDTTEHAIKYLKYRRFNDNEIYRMREALAKTMKIYLSRTCYLMACDKLFCGYMIDSEYYIYIDDLKRCLNMIYRSNIILPTKKHSNDMLTY